MSRFPCFDGTKEVGVYREEIKWVPDPDLERVADYTLFIDDQGRVLKQEMIFFGQILETVLDEQRVITMKEAEQWKARE